MIIDRFLPDAATGRREVVQRLGEAMTDRLAGIDLVVLDCDGIMTDGALFFDPDGEVLKVFDARDGLGLMLLWAEEIARAVLTGRTSPMVARRCSDLGFEVIKMARFDKLAALKEIQTETGHSTETTLYMGDDLLDLPAFTASALAVTVPGAPAEVRAASHLVTVAEAGHGAVREVCDLLLKARGTQAEALRKLIMRGHPGRLVEGRGP